MALIRRRTRAQLPTYASPPVAPATVLVRREVIRSIGVACESADDLETGGPLIGTVQRSWEPDGERLIVAVLGTVAPGPGLRAKSSSVALGVQTDGERAASALRWWRSATGLELVHVGDWHLHPAGVPEPSAGDVVTAGRMRRENGGPLWLAAIAVCAKRRDAFETKGHVARLADQGSSLELAFYRDVGRIELARMPIRVEGAAVPRLPELPWHVADPVRFAAECRLLDASGFKTAIASEGTTGLQLRIRRNGRALTVATGSAHPADEPKLSDERGRRIRVSGWTADRFLVDLVHEAC